MSSHSHGPVPKHQLIELYRQAMLAGVPIEVVHQKVQVFADRFQTTASVEEADDTKHLKKLKRALPLRTRMTAQVLPVVSVLLGMFFVANAAWPIATYLLFTSPELAQNALKAPVPAAMVLDSSRTIAAGVASMQALTATGASPSPAVLGASATVEPLVLADLDYTNLANWFPTETTGKASALQDSGLSDIEYQLDIPAVNVEKAMVRIGGSNLDKSLIQYPGTAQPGEPGSPVIFGHSVLRQFYNPAIKNPRRYMSIFSKIMTLKAGDEIFLTRDGVRYTYVVEEKTEVKPEDVFILEQNYGARTLKLVTCVPEGTYLRRGVVTAVLKEE